MTALARYLERAAERRRNRRAKLPWPELEAEAARQGCDPADIFFDRAGHRMPGLPTTPEAVAISGERLEPKLKRRARSA